MSVLDNNSHSEEDRKSTIDEVKRVVDDCLSKLRSGKDLEEVKTDLSNGLTNILYVLKQYSNSLEGYRKTYDITIKR